MANTEMLLSEKVNELKGTAGPFLREYIEVYKITSNGSELYEIIERSESTKSFETPLKNIGSDKRVAQAFRNAIENTPDIRKKLEILTAEDKCHELHPEIFTKYDEHQLLLDLDYYKTLVKLNHEHDIGILLRDMMHYVNGVELLERDDNNE